MRAARPSGRPWQAAARDLAQRAGLDPRYLRRLRWLSKAGAVRRSGQPIRRHWRFVVASPEPHNHTYDIANRSDLVAWTADVSGCELATAQRLIEEPGADVELTARLKRATAGHWPWTKRVPPFGKRLGWYALVRALRPRLVVETGVHDGLGSLLLLRALERNRREGDSGKLVSFDVNPSAGWLVGGHPLWELRLQSSREGLAEVLRCAGGIDLFIYDGWHTYEAEYADLVLAAARLSPQGVLLSDDAQVTHALRALCQERGLAYFEFHEVPVRHFHPGAVLGAGRRPSPAPGQLALGRAPEAAGLGRVGAERPQT